MSKMPRGTLRALKGSIGKWERIVAGTGTDRGTINCPLCGLFFDAGNGCGLGTAKVCPVAVKTGEPECEKTPYVDFCRSENTADARRMLAFLKRLLPKEDRA